MNTDRFSELAPLYAVGALDGPDLVDFETYLPVATSEEKREMASFHDTLSLIVTDNLPSHAPSPEIKENLLRSISISETEIPESERIEQFLEASVARGFSFTMESEGTWQELPSKGARIKELSLQPTRGYSVMLVELDPDTEYPSHHHAGPEEGFLLSGDLYMEGRLLRPGDFFHAESGSEHSIAYSEFGCRLLLLTSTKDYHPRALRFYNLFRSAFHWKKRLFTVRRSTRNSPPYS